MMYAMLHPYITPIISIFVSIIGTKVLHVFTEILGPGNIPVVDTRLLTFKYIIVWLLMCMYL